ncbi:branched-chain amino acid ABC transporter permease [Halomarina oriensis]|uniref:Branched-chain amino acid ABC transporter permease n=1 Tax=Halomarina oriensis TaxID=671145 RepID=A0A6B0GM55_9EURY|nr:branched-chain amino acid ABC transporter permease [Halomarina oriensis]MWG35976.1 branched-chain amino acid ABC transporter permease [Halomarina oriensis]
MSEDTASGRITEEGGRSLPSVPGRYVVGIVGLLLLALLPLLANMELGLGVPGVFVFVVDDLFLLHLTTALYFGMFAMSWDTVSGYTGQISFGHGLFFAVGAYTSALLNLGYGIDPILSIPAGIVLAAVAGIVIGVPALRLRGPYLSLVTLVAPLILLQLFIFRSDVFGGELGLRNPENFLGFGVNDAAIVYYIALGLFVAIMALLLVVTRSDAGRVFTAIREDEDAVSSVGINPAKFKIFAFVLSAAIGGLAGAMYVHTPVGGPTPTELMSTTVNVEVIIAAVLGGMGTIVGAAIGGIFVGIVPQLLDSSGWIIPGFLPVVGGTPVADIDFLIFAVITLFLLYVLPGGILRAVIRNGRRVRNSRRGDDGVATDGGQSERVFTRVLRGWREKRRGDDDE